MQLLVDRRSLVVKRSIVINRHKTSVSLEDAFWRALKEIARTERRTLSSCVAAIEQGRGGRKLSSAIRLFVVEHVWAQRRLSRDLTPTAPSPVEAITVGQSNDLPSAETCDAFAARLRARAAPSPGRVAERARTPLRSGYHSN
jgi:predicted DNA-binding ribbon-helix-helix protein